MAAPRGAFILFEGVDRSGKSTQTSRLAAALAGRGVAVEQWGFPDRSTATTGAAINAYLAGARELSDLDVHQLFSRNRWEKRDALLAALRSGTTLVVDRYAYSGVAYSAAKGVAGLDVAAAMAPDAGLPAPDLVVFLSVPPGLAASRAGYGGERYERREFQDKVALVFEQLHQAQTAPGGTKDAVCVDQAPPAGPAPGAWLVLDGSAGVEQVHTQVLAAALEAIACCSAGAPIRRLWDLQPLEEAAAGSTAGAGAGVEAGIN